MDLKRVYFRHDSQRYVHFALTEWDVPVLRKHIVWRLRKMLKLLKQILSYSRSKNLLDSSSEGAWKLPIYPFLIFCRFHANNDIERSDYFKI